MEILLSLAEVKKETKRYKETKELFKKALSIAKELKNSEDTSSILSSIRELESKEKES